LLLTLTVVLGILTANRFSTKSWPRFAQQDIHRRVSLLTLAFLGIHILTSLLDTYVNIGWAAALVPFTSRYDRYLVALGTVGVDLLLAVSLSSVLRQRISARLWRGLHWLACLSWPVALGHAFGMGSDMGEGWAIGLFTGCIVAVVAAAGWRTGSGLQRQRRTRSVAPIGVPMRSSSTWMTATRPSTSDTAASYVGSAAS